MRYSSVEVALLTEALAGSTRQWVPAQHERASSINEIRDLFIAELIDPESGFIDIEPHIAGVLSVRPGLQEVWFLTTLSDQRLFLDESTKLFGVALRVGEKDSKYVDAGVRTNDPIDAYLT